MELESRILKMEPKKLNHKAYILQQSLTVAYSIMKGGGRVKFVIFLWGLGAKSNWNFLPPSRLQIGPKFGKLGPFS